MPTSGPPLKKLCCPSSAPMEARVLTSRPNTFRRSTRSRASGGGGSSSSSGCAALGTQRKTTDCRKRRRKRALEQGRRFCGISRRRLGGISRRISRRISTPGTYFMAMPRSRFVRRCGALQTSSTERLQSSQRSQERHDSIGPPVKLRPFPACTVLLLATHFKIGIIFRA